MNQTFGCLPAIDVFSWIRTERDLNHFKYTVCPKFDVNLQFINDISFCAKINEHLCEKLLFKVFNNHRSYDKPFSTQINIIPKNNLITEYKNVYRMDFMDWVYNFGGIIGMWFGWSALSIPTALFTIYFYSWKFLFNLNRYFKIRRMIKESEKFSFISVENKQIIVYH